MGEGAVMKGNVVVVVAAAAAAAAVLSYPKMFSFAL